MHPALDVGLIEHSALCLDDASNIAELTLRIRGPRPLELAEDTILWRCHPNGEIKQLGADATAQLFCGSMCWRPSL